MNKNVKYVECIDEIDEPYSEIDEHFLKKSKKNVLNTSAFYINFDNISKQSELDEILKEIINMEKKFVKASKEKIIFYIKVSEKNKYSKEISEFFKVFCMLNTKEQYEYIYDVACDYFDQIFRENNLCKFENDACECQRKYKTKYKTMGCCHTFYYRKFDGMPVDTGECKYLTPTGCSTKSLGCKIFSCKHLRKMGYKLKSDDNLLLRVFLNKKQKKYNDETCFKTKEEMVGMWIELK